MYSRVFTLTPIIANYRNYRMFESFYSDPNYTLTPIISSRLRHVVVARHLTEIPYRHFADIPDTTLVAIDDFISEAGVITDSPVVIYVIIRNVNTDITYSPYAKRAFPSNVYWGETHLYTGLPLDMMGIALDIKSGTANILADLVQPLRN